MLDDVADGWLGKVGSEGGGVGLRHFGGGAAAAAGGESDRYSTVDELCQSALAPTTVKGPQAS